MATTSSRLFSSLASARKPASASLWLPATLLTPSSVPPPPLPAPGVACPGNHAILSMSGTFAPHQYPTSDYAPKPLVVSVAASNGHVFGGLVLGSLFSAGSVYVIAISFNSSSYYNISSHEVEQSVQNTATTGGETGYASSHLPVGIPMYRDNLPPAIRSSQPAPSTHQYLT
ncbi:hypothetical protein K1719_025753 [Acacia pycnantha]|nr:hypothetical protein K1719_025753 [Acacia pycnantha]